MTILNAVRYKQTPTIQNIPGCIQDKHLFGNAIVKFKKVGTHKQSDLHYFKNGSKTRHNTHIKYRYRPIRKINCKPVIG